MGSDCISASGLEVERQSSSRSEIEVTLTAWSRKNLAENPKKLKENVAWRVRNDPKWRLDNCDDLPRELEFLFMTPWSGLVPVFFTAKSAHTRH